jgi:hypothetical protein
MKTKAGEFIGRDLEVFVQYCRVQKITAYFVFRFIGSGKHIGKVLLKIRDEEPEKVMKPTTKLVSAIPRTYMNPDKSYVLVGKFEN